ncbi:4-keto-6-deoxy-N-Acetyl-D-hexosaminyl-(Lipid carrier) aminotransferase [Flavobacterium seoulense]|uniref:4-keto-6-deoxy-N-Acetyl-D-hexosaminyl-(Lipid carrier) aminotransferase n=2 Tax=Flavobacterium seoulense TaxID=1492738 RepID=A0A066WTG2_9FLAO|nr:4-keto-6-deoxy-N-Acetyl-D-hexosaminyl-(Lipid carrier) aminotransferase [Flavobacterium seoulense]
MGGNEMNYIQEAFDTNWIAPVGENINVFEQELETYLGNKKYVAALNSGTAAIHLGLILLGVRAGDEVICQSMTFAASANPILYLGAKPVFIDSETKTWNICPIALEEAITDRITKGKKPKAIIVVHLYGVPCQIELIRAIADKYDIPILEDSAEALGSKYNDRPCGTFGDIAIFSFNGSKIITTSGGGAIVTKTKQFKEKAIFLATQAKDNRPYYQHSEVGYNYRMSNISAAIGRGQMEVLDSRIKLRRKINVFYKDLFKDIPDVTVFESTDKAGFSNCWLTTILINSNNNKGITNEVLRLALESENIESRLLWKPMHLQPLFINYPYYGGNVSENLFKKGLCMPSGSNLTDVDRERISKTVKSVFEI